MLLSVSFTISHSNAFLLCFLTITLLAFVDDARLAYDEKKI